MFIFYYLCYGFFFNIDSQKKTKSIYQNKHNGCEDNKKMPRDCFLLIIISFSFIYKSMIQYTNVKSQSWIIAIKLKIYDY